MSNSLKRRMAKAALVLAAGAAPVMCAAGNASAATLPAMDLGSGLGDLDAAHQGGTVDGAARSTTELAGETGGELLSSGVPATGRTAGAAGQEALPAAERTVGDTTHTAGFLVGDTVRSAEASGLTDGSQTDDVSLF